MKPDRLDPSALSRERKEESKLGWASDQNPALSPRVRQKQEAELSLRRAVPAGGPAELAAERAESAAEARSRRRRGRRDAAGGGGPTLPWTPDWPTTERTFFRLEAEDPFLAGTRPDWQETSQLLSYLRARDICLLGMLHQHRYLSSDQLLRLFWPTAKPGTAYDRLARLQADLRLVLRWQQYAPRRRGSPAKRPSVYLLTDRGAAVLASTWGQQAKPIIRHAWHAAHHPMRIHHDLAVADFFVGLAVAAASWAGCGLYHWIGDDAMRRNHRLVESDLTPDGWGRLLMPNRELVLNLEWDAGTEGSLPLTTKLRLYADQLPPGEYVLFVAPHGPREQAIRQAVDYVLGPKAQEFPLLTTTVTALRRDGLLSAIWSPIANENSQLSLLELPGAPRSELEVNHALAKPDWWEARPGGGEGA
jgi:Replication-relaxation